MGLDLEDLANPYVVITILKSILDIFFRIYSYNLVLDTLFLAALLPCLFC
jgi:hypothetical protein